jgi:hypothetical protein
MNFESHPIPFQSDYPESEKSIQHERETTEEKRKSNNNSNKRIRVNIATPTQRGLAS